MSKINFINFKLFNSKIKNIFCVDATCSWIALIVFFSFLNLIVLASSVFLYFKIDNGQAFVSGIEVRENTSFERLRKSEIVEIITVFEQREEEFSKLKNDNSIDVIDPSL